MKLCSLRVNNFNTLDIFRTTFIVCDANNSLATYFFPRNEHIHRLRHDPKKKEKKAFLGRICSTPSSCLY